MSRSAGHVLVHYLYTGAYHTLEWVGPATSGDEVAAKLKTGFEVYSGARNYDIPGLEKLAKEEIVHLSNGIDACTVVDIVNAAYPFSTGEESWFRAYIKGVVKKAFNDPTVSEMLSPPENGAKDSIVKTILESALEVHYEMVGGEKWARPAMTGTKVEKGPSRVEDTPTLDEGWAAVGSKMKRRNNGVVEQVAEEVQVPAIEPGFPWGSVTAKDEKKASIWDEPVAEPEPVKAPESQTMLEEGKISPVDDIWFTGASKRDKKTKKKKGKSTAAKDFKDEEQPAEPVALLEPERQTKDGNMATGVITSNGSIFGGGSGSTMTGFGASARSNRAESGEIDHSGTARVAFTPHWEKIYGGETNVIQNILCMEDYRNWSSEELRLADYNQGRKGALGTFSFGSGNTMCGAKT